MRHFLFTLIFILAMSMACGINTAQNGDGGATETVNARVILLDSTISVRLQSHKQIYADIKVLSSNYNPATDKISYDSAIGISADSEIIFKLINEKSNVIVFESFTGKALILKNISIRRSISDTINDTLTISSSINGTVSYSYNTDIKPIIKVYLIGSPYQTEIDSNGSFILNNIPDGKYFIEAKHFDEKANGHENSRTVGRDIEISNSQNTEKVMLFFSN